MKRSRNANKNTPVEELCFKLPKEFTKYFNYWRSLTFEDKPCINDLKRLLKKLLSKKGLEMDGRFDWITKKSKIPQEIDYDDNQEEAPDYKKKLMDILKQS